MVIEVIVSIFAVILMGVISVFSTIPTIKPDGLEKLLDFIAITNTFVNLGVFVSCMVVILIFKNIEIVWSAVMWVVRKIPSIE